MINLPLMMSEIMEVGRKKRRRRFKIDANKMMPVGNIDLMNGITRNGNTAIVQDSLMKIIKRIGLKRLTGTASGLRDYDEIAPSRQIHGFRVKTIHCEHVAIRR